MANVQPAPGWMGISARDVTGQPWMGNARTALRLPFQGWMSEMGNKGMDTLVTFARWTDGVANYGYRPGRGSVINPENVGYGATLIEIVFADSSWELCSFTINGGTESGGEIWVYLDDQRHRYLWAGWNGGNGTWLSKAGMPGAFKNLLRRTGVQTKISFTR